MAGLALALAGCDDEPRPLPEGVVRRALPLDEPNGLSGLAVDEQGRCWAVAESDRALVRLDDGHPRVIPLRGVPDGVDTESMAWLGGERFAIGTESDDVTREGDDVLLGEVRGEVARVVERLALPYAGLGIHAEENHGIESLCAADGVLVAAFENVVEEDGARFAPLAMMRLGARRWHRHRVRLTTGTGKIAGLACRARGDTIEAHAIERHFDVLRILRLELPAPDASRATIVPRIVRVLDEQLAGEPNLEGIAYQGDEVLIVVDNEYGRRTGPNELFRLRL